MSGLTVKIITPEELVREAEVDEVIIPAKEGEMGILKDHISLLTVLKEGVVKLVLNKKVIDEFNITSGLCEVNDNVCKVLAEAIKKD